MMSLHRAASLLVVGSVPLLALAGCLMTGAPASSSPASYDFSQPKTYDESVARCMHTATGTQAVCEASARNQFGPQNPPKTAEQWASLEATVRQLLGGDAATPVQRLEAIDAAKTEIAATAGHCYRVALAWSEGGTTDVNVLYGTTNPSLAGTTKQMTAPGIFEVCADSAGTVTLDITALDANGALKLEVAAVVRARILAAGRVPARREHPPTRRSAESQGRHRPDREQPVQRRPRQGR